VCYYTSTPRWHPLCCTAPSRWYVVCDISAALAVPCGGRATVVSQPLLVGRQAKTPGEGKTFSLRENALMLWLQIFASGFHAHKMPGFYDHIIKGLAAEPQCFGSGDQCFVDKAAGLAYTRANGQALDAARLRVN
jgi:hypothetical protein